MAEFTDDGPEVDEFFNTIQRMFHKQGKKIGGYHWVDDASDNPAPKAQNQALASIITSTPELKAHDEKKDSVSEDYVFLRGRAAWRAVNPTQARNQGLCESDGSDPDDVVIFKGRAAERTDKEAQLQARLMQDTATCASHKSIKAEKTRVDAGEGINTTDKDTVGDPDVRIVTTSKGDVGVHGDGPHQWFTGSAEACVEYRRSHITNCAARYSHTQKESARPLPASSRRIVSYEEPPERDVNGR